MKKFITFLLTLALSTSAIMALSACAPKPDVDEFEGTTITFYHTMSATTLQPTLNKYIEKFIIEIDNYFAKRHVIVYFYTVT